MDGLSGWQQAGAAPGADQFGVSTAGSVCRPPAAAQGSWVPPPRRLRGAAPGSSLAPWARLFGARGCCGTGGSRARSPRQPPLSSSSAPLPLRPCPPRASYRNCCPVELGTPTAQAPSPAGGAAATVPTVCANAARLHPACLQNASLLQLLQQQAAMSQQQQPQQQRQQQQPRPQQAGGAGDANMNVSLAALLAQQPGGAAANGQQQFPGFSVPQQPAGYGFQPPPTAFAGQAATAPFITPNLLQQQMAAGAAGALPSGGGRSGSGSLPPAILQHQQAALARQAAAGTAVAALPGIPPASVASNGFGPEVQQAAWGAMPLPPFPMPLAGFGLEQQPASSTAAGAAGAAAGAAAAPQPKRRGRQPRDPSTLTEKQLRAREAQKRFRDKQKRMMAETEAAVGQTTDELQRLRCAGLLGCGPAWVLGRSLSRCWQARLACCCCLHEHPVCEVGGPLPAHQLRPSTVH